MGWAAFWIFCTVLVCCDYAVFHGGADSVIWQYRTPAELELQKHRLRAASPSTGEKP